MHSGKAEGGRVRAAPPPCEHCVLAGQCPAASLQDVLRTGNGDLALTRSYRVNACLQREGERAASLKFVKSGLLAVRQTGSEGVERAIAVIGPGNLLGQSAMTAQPSMFTIQALTPVSVCDFSTPVWQELNRPPPGGPAFLARYSRQVIRTLADWGGLVRLPGLSQRLALALRLIAEMQPAGSTQLPNQAVMAELLSVTRESINRAWKDFEARGIVRRRHRHAVDLDMAELERVSSLRD